MSNLSDHERAIPIASWISTQEKFSSVESPLILDIVTATLQSLGSMKVNYSIGDESQLQVPNHLFKEP